MKDAFQIPIQTKMLPTIDNLPIEIIQWGQQPDHYKIDLPHRHTFDELLFFKKGGGRHEIDFKEHEIKDCSIHFVKAGKTHFLQRDKFSEGFTVSFDPIILSASTMYRIVIPSVFGSELLHPIANLSENQFLELMEIARLLKKQIKEDSNFYRTRCFLSCFEMLANKIASHLEIGFSKPTQKELTVTEQLLCSYLHLVGQHATRQRNISWYAATLNISTNYLGKICMEHRGVSPKAILNEHLLTEAKKLLCNTKMSCKELAYGLGFKSGSQFSHFFKQLTGFPPNEYRSAT